MSIKHENNGDLSWNISANQYSRWDIFNDKVSMWKWFSAVNRYIRVLCMKAFPVIYCWKNCRHEIWIVRQHKIKYNDKYETECLVFFTTWIYQVLIVPLRPQWHPISRKSKLHKYSNTVISVIEIHNYLYHHTFIIFVCVAERSRLYTHESNES